MRPFVIHLALCLIVAIPLPGHAQGFNRSGVGIKGGAQWCRLGANDVSYTSIPGALVGAYAPFLLRKRLEIQPELLLSYQGGDLRVPEAPPATTRMLYVQLPVAVKLFLSNAFNLQCGPQAGLCVAAWQNGGTSTDNIRLFDAGLFGGLGLDMRSGLDLSARYYAGRRPVFAGDSGVNPRHRIVQASLGYRLLRMGGRQHRLRKR